MAARPCKHCYEYLYYIFFIFFFLLQPFLLRCVHDVLFSYKYLLFFLLDHDHDNQITGTTK